MPAQTESQRKAAGMALSAKRGNTPVSKLRGAALSMFRSMSEAELERMASKPNTKKSIKEIKRTVKKNRKALK